MAKYGPITDAVFLSSLIVPLPFLAFQNGLPIPYLIDSRLNIFLLQIMGGRTGALSGNSTNMPPTPPIPDGSSFNMTELIKALITILVFAIGLVVFIFFSKYVKKNVKRGKQKK